MSKTFFIGDLHLGHNGISTKFRTEFTSDDEHHKTVHQNVLECSGNRNDLFLMGDIALKQDYFPWIGQYIASFRAVHIILGNHDHKALARYAIENGALVHGLMKKWGFWLSHCPIHPTEQYSTVGNIHGHMHENVVKKTIDSVEVSDPYYINVSCEQIAYKSIAFEDLKDRVLDTKLG